MNGFQSARTMFKKVVRIHESVCRWTVFSSTKEFVRIPEIVSQVAVLCSKKIVRSQESLCRWTAFSSNEEIVRIQDIVSQVPV